MVQAMERGFTLSQNIADKIKTKIMTGEFALGSKLPNENELMDDLNVSRTTIREAVKILISKNILYIEREGNLCCRHTGACG